MASNDPPLHCEGNSINGRGPSMLLTDSSARRIKTYYEKQMPSRPIELQILHGRNGLEWQDKLS